MNILVIKTGAVGDVVRTTPILPFLEGNVFWLTSRTSGDLFENNKYITKTFYLEHQSDLEEMAKIDFALILSLEEDIRILKMIHDLKHKKLIGLYFDKNNKNVGYTKESSQWFDMSLVSRLGRERADKLKKKNNKTYQHHLFSMLNLKFDNHPYQLGYDINKEPKFKVGVERKVGDRWPTKAWGGYDVLLNKLKKQGISSLIFKERQRLRDYIRDINNCELIVSGDTLAMHLALALKKKAIAIFSPTPPQEIHDYGQLVKLYKKETPCFSTFSPVCSHNPRCIDQIPVDSVYEKIIKNL